MVVYTWVQLNEVGGVAWSPSSIESSGFGETGRDSPSLVVADDYYIEEIVKT